MGAALFSKVLLRNALVEICTFTMEKLQLYRRQELLLN